MRILIYERDHTGHRTMAVRVLVDAILDLQASHPVKTTITLATTADAIASPQFAEHIAPVADRLNLLTVPADAPGIEPGHALRHAWAKLRDIRHLLAADQMDHLFIPYGDGLIQALTAWAMLPGLVSWPTRLTSEAVLMRTSFANAGAPASAQWLGRLGIRLSPFTRLHLIDPIAWRYLRRHSPTVFGRVGLLPDPVSETARPAQSDARHALGLPIEGRVVGMIGYLDARKGADRLIRAFRDAPLAATDRLLFAGPQADTMRNEILAAARADSRIVVIDRYLVQSDMANALAAVDLLAAPYRHFSGSASMVIRAAAAGRPCLGANNGWMAYVIPRFALGTVCDPDNPAEFTRALSQAMETCTSFSLGQDGQRFVEYYRLDNIYAQWTALLRERLGLPAHPGWRAWPDDAQR